MAATSTPCTHPEGVDLAAPDGRPADEMSFDTLVERYYRKIFKQLLRMVRGDTHVASDLTQDVFTQAFRALPMFRGDSNIHTWLYHIAANRGKSWIRENRRDSARMVGFANNPIDVGNIDIDLQPDETNQAYAPEQAFQRRELQAKVNEAVAALPSNFRLVIVLCDLEGLRYQEIADIGIPEGTVKSRLNKARYELQKLLRPYLDADLAVPG